MRFSRLAPLLVYIMFLNVGAVLASEQVACCGAPVTDDKNAAYIVVNSEEVRALLQNKTPDLSVVDARTPKEFEKAHIQGAINIPVEQLEIDATLLPVPKHAKLVFYCNGVKCGKSKISANIAMDQGYSDVSVYIDGMPVWAEKGYPISSE